MSRLLVLSLTGRLCHNLSPPEAVKNTVAGVDDALQTRARAPAACTYGGRGPASSDQRCCQHQLEQLPVRPDNDAANLTNVRPIALRYFHLSVDGKEAAGGMSIHAVDVIVK
eukprot:6172739-Pleurochrysis_carterae.AAC.1